MPEFANPFPGMTPGNKMTERDLVRVLRLDLAAEEEAIDLYTAQADAADNVPVKVTLEDIANEERVHVGEFQRLIEVLTEDEQELMHQGAVEVNKKFPKLSGVGVRKK